MAGDKSHKKKKPSKKAQKKKVAKGAKQTSKDGAEKAEPMSQEAARKQNPKAFVFSSRGKAKVQKARSAEKEQRRMHGEHHSAVIFLMKCEIMTGKPNASSI